jgi:putative flavoprotein involved in K+ transport
VVTGEPGLYFLGLLFQHSLTSANLGGIGADARYIAEQLRSRAAARDVAAPQQVADMGVR